MPPAALVPISSISRAWHLSAFSSSHHFPWAGFTIGTWIDQNLSMSLQIVENLIEGVHKKLHKPKIWQLIKNPQSLSYPYRGENNHLMSTLGCWNIGWIEIVDFSLLAKIWACALFLCTPSMNESILYYSLELWRNCDSLLSSVHKFAILSYGFANAKPWDILASYSMAQNIALGCFSMPWWYTILDIFPLQNNCQRPC